MSKVRRLYKDFQPTSYDLKITPDFKRLNFEGSVVINGKPTRATKVIRLHGNGLKITAASANSAPASNIIINHKTHEISLHFSQTLPAKTLKLSLEFKGNVKDNLHGLYKSQFKYRGKPQVILATQCEANHAREIFPCIDEPEAKAIFKLQITAPKSLTVLANTPVSSQMVVGANKQVSFKPSPKMSPYLLAFLIGKLAYRETKSKRGVKVRVYATPGNLKNVGFALKTGADILDFYESYFKIPYPLPKLDMVALPDFAAGAMENWGLVTYREQLLLVDAKNSSLSTKQYVALVVAHELAHQWFGNLVTMKWWTDLWLNEGFASWIEYLAIDKLFPDWDMWTQFVSSEYMQALEADALANTHPVEVPINDPEEIQQVFDSISYQKGASVIRMLHQYLGEAAFQNGLVKYLRKHKFANATTTDLWSALSKVSKKDVKGFMGKWTGQPGYPLVHYNSRPQGYKFSQERFVLNQRLRNTVKQYNWPVPISEVGTNKQFLLRTKSANWQRPPILNKLNSGQSGLYRVAYATSELQRFGDAVSSKSLPPEDRMGLLADVFELTKAGIISTPTTLDLMQAYRQEDNAAVWDVMAGVFGQILRILIDDATETPYLELGRALAIEQVKRLGWKASSTETHFDKLLRPTVLGLAGRCEDPDVVAEIKRQFTPSKIKQLHPDLRSAVYSYIGRHASSHEYAELLRLYKATDMAEEKVRLAAALCNARSAALIKRSLGMIRGPQVRLQEAPGWIARLLLNKHATKLAWTWLQTNWDWFIKNFGPSYYAGRIVTYVGEAVFEEPLAKDIKTWLNKNSTPGLKRSIDQAYETAEMQAKWRQRDQKLVARCLPQ